MERPEEPEVKLLEYIDGTLDEKERMELEEILKASPALGAKLQHLRAVDALLQTAGPVMPGKNFTARVMQGLFNNPRPKVTFLHGLLLLLGVITVVSLCSIFLAAGLFDAGTTLDLNQVGILRKYIPASLPSFGMSGKLLIQIIIILNLATGFIVLDRAVLRPFFQSRARAEI